MRPRLKYLYISLICCFGFASFSQDLTDDDIKYFKKYEDSLNILQKKVFATKTDTAKFRINSKFWKLLDEVLLNDKSFYYPFDSLKQISRLASKDQKVRLITWNLNKDDGSYHYFGFLQSQNSKTKHYDLHPLTDKSAGVKANPENYISDNTKWFGMLYYDIVPYEDHYILLAWDGNDKTVCRKFIDVLSFKSDGSPVFGKDVFKYPKKNPKRVMFEYSAKVTMSVRFYNGGIICDHLAAKDEMNEGMAQFYGPDFSLDAFFPARGKWVFEPDVDVKNPRSKNDNVKPSDKKEKPVYTPK